jgi:TfoX N-terminal domain
MAFDETLAARTRKALGKRAGLTEKQMFGGLAFLLRGNMAVGVHASEMIVRLAPEETDAALAERHVRVFDLTGRPMKGWVLVESAGIASDAALQRWVERGVKFAASLPAKSGR